MRTHTGFKKLGLNNVKSAIFIEQEDIIFVKALGSYSEIITITDSHVISRNLKLLEEKLDPYMFFRGHNSSIINLGEVKEFIYEGNYVVMSNGTKLRVSNSKKDEFIERINNF